MNNIPQKILEQIKIHCHKYSDQEACGIIYKSENELHFLECDNLSDNRKYHFIIDPMILIDYDVKYIVHSHINSSAKPSECDVNNANELCIPFLIYSLCYDNFYLYDNISV